MPIYREKNEEILGRMKVKQNFLKVTEEEFKTLLAYFDKIRKLTGDLDRESHRLRDSLEFYNNRNKEKKNSFQNWRWKKGLSKSFDRYIQDLNKIISVAQDTQPKIVRLRTDISQDVTVTKQHLEAEIRKRQEELATLNSMLNTGLPNATDHYLTWVHGIEFFMKKIIPELQVKVKSATKLKANISKSWDQEAGVAIPENIPFLDADDVVEEVVAEGEKLNKVKRAA